MEKDGTIIMSDWGKGLAESPFVGYGRFQNLDGYSEPGILRQTFNLQDISGDIASTPQYFAINPSSGQIWVQCENGGVHYDDGSDFNQVPGNTAGTTTGLVIWCGYLFSFRNAGVDLLNLSNNTWSNAWSAMSGNIQSVSNHYAFVGQDNVLYYCNGRYIGRIVQVGTFNPSNPATYSISGTYLDTKDDNITTEVITELSNFLVFGATYTGGIGYSDLLYWDRTSSSTLLTGRVRIQENVIKQIININNVISFNTGTNMYNTVLSTTKKVLELKNIFTSNGLIPSLVPASRGAITNWNDGLLWGVGTANLVPTGLYYLKDKGLFYYTFDGSTEDGSSGTALTIGCVIGAGETFYVGGRKGSSYKIYKANVNLTATADAAFFESPLYYVSQAGQNGIQTVPRTFQMVEFFLSEPLPASGEIILEYRTTKNGSWTPGGTFDYSAWANKDYIVTSFAPSARQIQFKVTLNGGVKLRSVRVK